MTAQIKRGSKWWDRWFLNLAKYISTASKDPSTQVGCVIVGPDREIRSTGFNGFPRGVQDTIERLNDRQQKYSYICHGEENAVTHAARIGVSLKDCTAYIYPIPPCSKCSRALIQSGIHTIFYPKCTIPDRWIDDINISLAMLKEAEVHTITIDMENE